MVQLHQLLSISEGVWFTGAIGDIGDVVSISFRQGRRIYILGHERQENEEVARVMNLSKRCNATC